MKALISIVLNGDEMQEAYQKLEDGVITEDQMPEYKYGYAVGGIEEIALRTLRYWYIDPTNTQIRLDFGGHYLYVKNQPAVFNELVLRTQGLYPKKKSVWKMIKNSFVYSK